MLRNRLGANFSKKEGCEVQVKCGACTVIIDGETVDSCIYLAVYRAEGKNISAEHWKAYLERMGIKL